jgi:hypothetical protein
MEKAMKNKVGLWIDHRKAVIVIVSDKGEEIQQITSGMEKHVRFSGNAAEDGAAEDVSDRQFGNHLNNYYAKVMEHLRDAETIHIFGPGEAKVELEARLEKEGLKGRIVQMETMDKMTDRQIASKVRGYKKEL